MMPTHFITMSSHYDIMPYEAITSALSSGVPNSDEELIAHWIAWKNQVPNVSNERRDIVLANLAKYMECSSGAEYALDLSGLNLTELPNYWPSDLGTLNVSDNNLITLPTTFPLSLSYLDAQNNRLTSLPENLPPELVSLEVSDNQLTTLPLTLPDSLESLHVNNNQLTALPPTLPNALEIFSASENQITSLPENLPPGLTDLDVSNNLLTRLFVNVPESLESLTADNNYITQWPENLFSHDRYVSYYNNPVQPVNENTSVLTDEISLWISQTNTNLLGNIPKEENALIFSSFLGKLIQGKNAANTQLKNIVSEWLVELRKEENADLRQQTFAIVLQGTESCVDRASYYFNQMYSLMMEDRLLKNNASVFEAFQTRRGLFSLQQLEMISAARVDKRIQTAPGFDEDIEIYLAYQFYLRKELDLPIYTQLQFENIAKLSDEDLNAAKTQIIETEKQDFIRFLVNDSETWKKKLKGWDNEKVKQADDVFLEEIDKLASDTTNLNSYNVRSKSMTDQLHYDIYFPLTKTFLEAHELLSLLEGFHH